MSGKLQSWQEGSDLREYSFFMPKEREERVAEELETKRGKKTWKVWDYRKIKSERESVKEKLNKPGIKELIKPVFQGMGLSPTGQTAGLCWPEHLSAVIVLNGNHCYSHQALGITETKDWQCEWRPQAEGDRETKSLRTDKKRAGRLWPYWQTMRA